MTITDEGLLSGLTVLSLEQATVIPWLTYRLALDGARVIRIEDPARGDPNRFVGEDRLGERGMNSYFLPINAGKQAVTLNLAGARGRELLHQMIDRLKVDVFCTNQLPRNYAKLGIAYEDLRPVRPELIWLGVTGFGPESDEAAYDPVLQAKSGLMDLNGEAGGPPLATSVPFIDLGTAEHAYGQVMKALYKRAASGGGSRLDISMFQSACSWLAVPLSLFLSFGVRMGRRGNTHEFFAPVSVYPAMDGYVYLAVGNDRQWRSLVELGPFAGLDRREYDTNAGRIRDVANLNIGIGRLTRAFVSAALVELLRGAGVPVAPVRDLAAVAADPLVRDHLLASRDPVTGTDLVLAPPPCPAAGPKSISFPPRLGEHNREIYGGDLGLDEDTLAALAAQHII